MTPESYIAERIEQYRGWYDSKAVSSKSKYLRLRCCAIVSGALVPVLVNLPWKPEVLGLPVLQVVITLLSLLVVAAVSFDSVFNYREQWQNYRSTEQFLGHETFRFGTRVGCYAGLAEAAAFALLVERVETAIAVENAATLQALAATLPSGRSMREQAV